MREKNRQTFRKPSLFPHEWLAILFIATLLILLTLASHSCNEEVIEVLPLESIEDSPSLKKPLSIKNLKNQKKSRVKKNQKISVRLCFPGGNYFDLEVPKGTRLEQLNSYYCFQEDLDIRKIQRKRVLKQGEEIHFENKK